MSEEKIAKKQVADHRPLHEVVFVILDLETSGAAPSTGAGITEIGAVKVCGGEIIGEFQTFVNPQHGLSDFITSLTGITDDMLADAPKPIPPDTPFKVGYPGPN
jgi:DNA polymerase III alpha subunit (gram-positive type)